jgi:hypothetical protein
LFSSSLGMHLAANGQMGFPMTDGRFLKACHPLGKHRFCQCYEIFTSRFFEEVPKAVLLCSAGSAEDESFLWSPFAHFSRGRVSISVQGACSVVVGGQTLDLTVKVSISDCLFVLGVGGQRSWQVTCTRTRARTCTCARTQTYACYTHTHTHTHSFLYPELL